MKRVKLEDMTIDQLVDRFAEIGIAQNQADLYDEHAKYNRLFEKMNQVDNELKARGTEARLALLRLYDHPNIQVQVKSAIRTLGVAPIAARNVLEAIRVSKEYPQAADAGMIINGLDDGTFKPT